MPLRTEQSGYHSKDGSVDPNLEDGDPLPLYHIEGVRNIADLLTKELYQCTGCF